MPKDRLETFIDVVIATIMIILVLELREPNGDTWEASVVLGYRLFIYTISFIVLTAYQNNHHHLSQVVHKISGRVLWVNSLFIFVFSLFPFATSWISGHINSLTPETTYGLVTLIANIAHYILAEELVRADKGHEKTLKAMLNDYRRPYLSIGLNVLGIVLGYLIAPVVVLIANIMVLVAWIIPSRAIES